MADSKYKTIGKKQSVTQFLNNVEIIKRKMDAKKVLNILKKITGVKPKV